MSDPSQGQPGSIDHWLCRSRRELESLDRELLSSWGIEVRSFEQKAWWEDLARELPDGEFERFRDLHDRYGSAVSSGQDVADLETDFYAAIAVDPLCGFVHSHRRAVILDAVALIEGLVAEESPGGAVLDVGCHAGYLAARLARHPTLDLTGVDLCRPALELGRERCEELGRPVQFLWTDARDAELSGPYQVVVAIDVLPEDAEGAMVCLRQFSRLLSDDGLLVISNGLPIEETWGSREEEVGEVFTELRLGLLAAGCLGGCPGAGLEPLAQSVLVFRRGADPVFCPADRVELAWHSWPEFLDYTADPRVPDREKTQAWFYSR